MDRADASEDVPPPRRRASRSHGASPPRAAWDAAAAHAQVLRRAREDAGLSQRALAARLGLSWVTVRQAELGRDLRHATLERWLAVLPTASARGLLTASAHAVPAARLDVWEAVRALTGFSSRSVARRVVLASDGSRLESTRVAGLASDRGSASEATVRRDLMMAACEGSGSALPRVLAAADDPRPDTLRFEEGGLEHAFRLGLGRDARVGYACVRRSPAGSSSLPSTLDPAEALRLGLFVRASHPTRRLSLRVRLPRGARPAAPEVVAWPESLLPGETDLAVEHHGGPVPLVLRRDGADLAFEVAHPLPGVCYAACWDGLDDDGRRAPFVPARPVAQRSLGQRLRAAREGAGLSRRALASRMGVSDALVRTSEGGRDVRRSTLGLYLRALPALRPGDVLRARPEPQPVRREELERTWRDLFGCEALEEHEVMTVRENGDCEIVHLVRGLRALEGRERVLRLLHPQQPSFYPHEPPRCRRVDVARGDDEGIRTRLHQRADGRVVQEVVVSATLARSGASFRREVVRRGVFHVTAERARALRGPEGAPYMEGAMLYSSWPARRRVLEVRFPKGYWPARIRAQAWPASAPPYAEHHEVASRLHPEGLAPRLARNLSRVVLAIERPVVGFKYALVWQLP